MVMGSSIRSRSARDPFLLIGDPGTVVADEHLDAFGTGTEPDLDLSVGRLYFTALPRLLMIWITPRPIACTHKGSEATMTACCVHLRNPVAASRTASTGPYALHVDASSASLVVRAATSQIVDQPGQVVGTFLDRLEDTRALLLAHPVPPAAQQVSISADRRDGCAARGRSWR